MIVVGCGPGPGDAGGPGESAGPGPVSEDPPGGSEQLDLVERTGLSPTDEGWGDRRVVEVDLDGVGLREVVTLAAQVERQEGVPLWDDGQVWAVVVQGTDHRESTVYARFVQLGRVEMQVVWRGGARVLLILERWPMALIAYEIAYRGPDDFEATQVGSWDLDEGAVWTGDPPLP
jgi:hypothetical protein